MRVEGLTVREYHNLPVSPRYARYPLLAKEEMAGPPDLAAPDICTRTARIKSPIVGTCSLSHHGSFCYKFRVVATTARRTGEATSELRSDVLESLLNGWSREGEWMEPVEQFPPFSRGLWTLMTNFAATANPSQLPTIRSEARTLLEEGVPGALTPQLMNRITDRVPGMSEESSANLNAGVVVYGDVTGGSVTNHGPVGRADQYPIPWEEVRRVVSEIAADGVEIPPDLSSAIEEEDVAKARRAAKAVIQAAVSVGLSMSANLLSGLLFG